MLTVLLSFGLITLCSAGTWSDDGVYSFDSHDASDLGWKIYPEEKVDGAWCPLENKDLCDIENICAVSDGGNYFYGPFPSSGSLSQKNYLSRRFHCAAQSDVEIKYKVLSCGASKGNSIPTVGTYGDGPKTSIVTSGGTGGCVESANPPTAWITQTAPQQVTYTVPWTVSGNEAFVLKIKNSIKSGTNWIYDLKVTCTPTGTSLTVSPNPVPTSDEYCVAGYNTAYNGEYAMAHNDQGDQAKMLSVNGVNTFYFEKRGVNGNAVLFQTDAGNGNYVWSMAPTTAGTVAWQCLTGVDAYTTIESDYTICNGVLDGVVGGTITMGECANHRTIISHIFSVLHLDLTENEIETVGILAILCLCSCMLGMVTCYFCQLICNRRKDKKYYNQVSGKDIDDIDF